MNDQWSENPATSNTNQNIPDVTDFDTKGPPNTKNEAQQNLFKIILLGMFQTEARFL